MSYSHPLSTILTSRCGLYTVDQPEPLDPLALGQDPNSASRTININIGVSVCARTLSARRTLTHVDTPRAPFTAYDYANLAREQHIDNQFDFSQLTEDLNNQISGNDAKILHYLKRQKVAKDSYADMIDKSDRLEKQYADQMKAGMAGLVGTEITNHFFGCLSTDANPINNMCTLVNAMWDAYINLDAVRDATKTELDATIVERDTALDRLAYLSERVLTANEVLDETNDETMPPTVSPPTVSPTVHVWMTTPADLSLSAYLAGGDGGFVSPRAPLAELPPANGSGQDENIAPPPPPEDNQDTEDPLPIPPYDDSSEIEPPSAVHPRTFYETRRTRAVYLAEQGLPMAMPQ